MSLHNPAHRNRLAVVLTVDSLVLAWVLVVVIIALGPGARVNELALLLAIADTAFSLVILRQLRDKRASRAPDPRQSPAARAPRGFEINA
jgi:hypothetical protein